MIGIEAIGSYFPERIRSNFDLKSKFEMDDYFIMNKIGVQEVRLASDNEMTSDLCIRAYEQLVQRISLNRDEIDLLVLVTQNPDKRIPHTSAVIHGKLAMPEHCACFDISLGCSGFVYALSVVEALMKQQDMNKALLFTCDPYSKIMDWEDKNTSLLFGDAATVTLLSRKPKFISMKYNYGTIGRLNEELEIKNETLYMNGRSIFEFAARAVPSDIRSLLKKNSISMEEVDLFLFHQGSKYIIDTLRKRLALPEERIPFHAAHYGNTVSSSIPLMLEAYSNDERCKTILLSGFGVGLSWASTVIRRV